MLCRRAITAAVISYSDHKSVTIILLSTHLNLAIDLAFKASIYILLKSLLTWAGKEDYAVLGQKLCVNLSLQNLCLTHNCKEHTMRLNQRGDLLYKLLMAAL